MDYRHIKQRVPRLASLGQLFLAAALLVSSSHSMASPLSPDLPQDASEGASADQETIEAITKIADDANRNAAEAARQARRAQQEAQRARWEAKQTVARSAEEQAKAEKAAEEAERNAQQARADAAEADRKSGEAEKKREEAIKAAEAAQRRALWIGGGAAVALLIALLLAMVFVRRARAQKITPVDPVMLRSANANLRLDGGQLPLEAGGVMIGRNPEEANAVINANEVSRKHACVFHENERYWIKDLGSLNKTYLNGEELEPNQRVEIKTGDMVGFTKEFEFSIQIAGGD